MTLFDIIQMLVKLVVVVALAVGIVPILVWLERRGAAWMQGRVGPNRVGPFGLLQPLADALKAVIKESFIPTHVNPFFYLLAPFILLIAPLCAMATIPFGSYAIVLGQKVGLQIAQVDSGILLLLAFAGLEVYPVILAGWASHNKYSVFGALRGSSQMISYEIAMGMSILSMLVIYGSFNMQEMVAQQGKVLFGIIPLWGVILNPIGALIFFVAMFAETNRTPFDLPEGDSEIVAGYHVEYGGMKFALFMMAEYVAMVMASALMATLFFGGFNLLPGMQLIIDVVASAMQFGEVGIQNLTALLQFVSMFSKMFFFLFVYIWVRWTVPRFRYDQLMDLGWKILFPLSFVNLIAMIGLAYFKA